MEPPVIANTSAHAHNADPSLPPKPEDPSDSSQPTNDSQTASEFIDSQLQLEADAREILPYAFDSCTHSLGALRQNLFSCLTCNPPPESPTEPYSPAGVCYSCSIACHGEHTLVELFNKRNFVCDCGTTRFPSTSPCTLRANPETGVKGVYSEKAAEENRYNQNFRNRFCGCGEVYDANAEKGTMFQCVGLGTVENGGCGEDWWHPECIAGLKRDWHKKKDDEHLASQPTNEEERESEDPPLPAGFPDEDDFDAFICYKCVDSNPWIKRYAGSAGFLEPFFKKEPTESVLKKETEPASTTPPIDSTATQGQPPLGDGQNPLATATNDTNKRKLEDDPDDDATSTSTLPKRPKTDTITPSTISSNPPPPECKYDHLPPPQTGTLSLFCKEDFREHICHCPTHFPLLRPFPQLLEEEETYEPPLSESGNNGDDAASGARSHGTASLLDRGEAALSNVDRVRAIEGVMVYNHLRDKVKAFLQPFAESGRAVGAEDIKQYFEKLRGDEEGIRAAAKTKDMNGGGSDGDNRREQSGF